MGILRKVINKGKEAKIFLRQLSEVFLYWEVLVE